MGRTSCFSAFVLAYCSHIFGVLVSVMTLVDVIDLEYDDWYVKVDVIDLSTDEDSVKKYGNFEEDDDDNVPRSEIRAEAATSSPISEQDATASASQGNTTTNDKVLQQWFKWMHDSRLYK
jgi:hypothetical protein